MHKDSWFWIPNALTISRILLAPLVAVLFVGSWWWFGLAVLLMAALTDLLDGWLARHFRWVSPLGSWLDPLADKLMTVIVAVTLLYLDRIQPLLMITVVMRDLVIVGGALFFRWRVGAYRGEPLKIGKWATAMLFLTFLLLVLSAASEQDWPWLMQWQWAVTLLLILSGLAYVREWSHRYRIARDAQGRAVRCGSVLRK